MTDRLHALPDGVRLGVSPLSWTNEVLDDLGGDTPAEVCLSDAAAAGYQGVENGRKLPRRADELAPLLSTYGLDLISGWHSGFLAERSVRRELETVQPFATLLRAMGCRVMVYGEVGMMVPDAPMDAPMSRRLRMPAEDIPAYAARLGDFARQVKGAYGLTLAYHHHLMMIAETFDEISAVIDKASADVGLLLDTGHAYAAGFDYGRLFDRFGDRIVHIHLKDVRESVRAEVRAKDLGFNRGVRKGMFTVPGDGAVDFAPLAGFVRQSGYRGWLVVEAEQDPAIAPPRPAVTRALAHIISVFESSGAGPGGHVRSKT